MMTVKAIWVIKNIIVCKVLAWSNITLVDGAIIQAQIIWF